MTSRTFVAVVNKVSSCSSVAVVDDAAVDSEAVADDDLDEVAEADCLHCYFDPCWPWC